MTGGLAPDAIHFPADLLEMIQRAGIFRKCVVGVILNPQIGEIHHSGGGCPADTLLHGFGRIAEAGAQLCHGVLRLAAVLGQR